MEGVRMSKNQWLIIVIFMFIAIVFRFQAAWRHDGLLEKDSLVYDQCALSVLKGEGIRSQWGELSAYRPPLYIYFLAVHYKIFGHHLMPVRIVQALLSTLTVATMGCMSYRIFGARSCLFTVIISSIYPPFYNFWFSCAFIGTETLYAFLLIISVYTLVLCFMRKSSFLALLAGVFWGLAILCRPEPLLLIPFLPFAMILIGFQLRAVLKFYSLLIVMVALVIMPWTVRNYLLFQSLIPVVSSGGMALYASNHPGSDGFGTEFFSRVIVPEDFRLQIMGKNERERSFIFMRKAVNYMREYPAAFGLLFLKKCFFYLDYNHTHYFKNNVKKRVINWGYVFVSFGAFFGLLAGCKDAGSKRWIILIMFIFVFFLISHAFVLSSYRYRLPTESLLIILSAYGWNKCFSGGIFRGSKKNRLG
jgi:4-amino-4-deoxy-L-arabinose transferase-like glycosyltransferase